MNRLNRLLASLGGGLVIAILACSDSTTAPPDIATTTFASALNVQLGAMTKTASGLYYQDSIVGSGVAAKTGDSITVNYILWLPTGERIDAGSGYKFRLGLQRVIAGWDEGLVGVKVGGWRKLVIPPALAYGDRSPGPGIPANAILVFNVQLVAVQ
jgi:FKBP-type peptidyl-prolyl cis-trans isomerase FkpA